VIEPQVVRQRQKNGAWVAASKEGLAQREDSVAAD
jgi:hypothetical protein